MTLSIAQSNEKFMYKIQNIHPDSSNNRIFSSFSVHVLGSILELASKGKTKQEIREVFHFPNNDLKIQKEYQDFLQHLNDYKDTLITGNNIFVNDECQLSPDFVSQMKEYYLVKPKQINVKEPKQACNKINSWVEEITHQKIKNLVQPAGITNKTSVLLINAVYFKAKWSQEFYYGMTTSKEFRSYGGDRNRTEKVNMMIKKDGKYRFHREVKDLCNCTILQLPYQNENLNMYIVLPSEDDGLEDVKKELNKKPDLLPSLIKEIKKDYQCSIDIEVPRFKCESEHKLQKPLKELGCPTMFSRDADFSGIREQKDLKVSDVIQKAIVEVDEEGTVAAAATSFSFEFLECAVIKPRRIICDHPFLFFIRDDEKEMTIFDGQVLKPEIAEAPEK